MAGETTANGMYAAAAEVATNANDVATGWQKVNDELVVEAEGILDNVINKIDELKGILNGLSDQQLTQIQQTLAGVAEAGQKYDPAAAEFDGSKREHARRITQPIGRFKPAAEVGSSSVEEVRAAGSVVLQLLSRAGEVISSEMGGQLRAVNNAGMASVSMAVAAKDAADKYVGQ